MQAQTATANPAAFLTANLGKLSANDQTFAKSLLSKKNPSPKVAHWIGVLAERVTEADKPKAPAVDVSGVLTLFARASGALKRPRVLVSANGKDLRLTVAGPTSKAPGSINVTSTGDYENREWFGRVALDGTWQPSQKVQPETATAIVAALRAIAEYPAGAAKAYGDATGNCCFCSIKLTDKRSITAGYGPICANNYGLPWGEDR